MIQELGTLPENLCEVKVAVLASVQPLYQDLSRKLGEQHRSLQRL